MFGMKRELYENITVPTATYWAETLGMRMDEMFWKEDIRECERSDNNENMSENTSEIVDRKVSKSFRLGIRMSREWLTIGVQESVFEGRRNSWAEHTVPGWSEKKNVHGEVTVADKCESEVHGH